MINHFPKQHFRLSLGLGLEYIVGIVLHVGPGLKLTKWLVSDIDSGEIVAEARVVKLLLLSSRYRL